MEHRNNTYLWMNVNCEHVVQMCGYVLLQWICHIPSKCVQVSNLQWPGVMLKVPTQKKCLCYWICRSGQQCKGFALNVVLCVRLGTGVLEWTFCKCAFLSFPAVHPPWPCTTQSGHWLAQEEDAALDGQ